MKNLITLFLLLTFSSISLADCSTDPANEFQTENCGFDANTDGWTNSSASGMHDSDDYQSSGSSGSFSITPNPGFNSEISRCSTLSSSADKTAGAWFKTSSGSGVTCFVRSVFYSSANCGTGFISQHTSSSILVNSSTWTQISGDTAGSLAGANSARLDLACTSGSDFIIKIDNVYLVPQGNMPVELQSFDIE